MDPILRRTKTMRSAIRCLGILALTTTVLGCGSITPLGVDGGGGASGGSGGGAAGRGGGGSPGGAGGSGGGGGGGSPDRCPSSAPTMGNACAPEGLSCEYGNDPRGDNCRTQAACSSGHW